jgi:hypothetical protein
MDVMTKLRSFAVLLFPVIVLFSAACTLRVEKLPTYGINDQHFEFDPNLGSWQDSVFAFCRNGTISTPAGELDKGRYEVTVVAKGSQAYHVYPTLKVMLNRKLLQEVQLDSSFSVYHLPFVLEGKDAIRIRVRFDQDGGDDQGNDRNVYIRKILVSPVSH